MSLINDALKRAKEAQQQNPPPTGGPALKLAEPATTKPASNAKSWLYLMVACVVLGNALLFFAIKDRGAKSGAAPATPTGPAAAPANPAPVIAAAVAPAAPPPAKVPIVSANATPVGAPVVVVVETNSVAAQPEPPKPAPLKLQSIIYNPSRPSAMISGKFLFVGDKVQGFRVTAINQETVTLIGNGQTNVLSLP